MENSGYFGFASEITKENENKDVKENIEKTFNMFDSISNGVSFEQKEIEALDEEEKIFQEETKDLPTNCKVKTEDMKNRIMM